MGDDEEYGAGGRFMKRFQKWCFAPIIFVKEKIVEPMQARNEPIKYYHRRFRRVPTIDECYTDDPVCIHEANEQFRRDKMVDERILCILRTRYLNCLVHEREDRKRKCQSVFDEYEEAETNQYIKYGELGAYISAYKAFIKQKHRMVYERRHPEWKQW